MDNSPVSAPPESRRHVAILFTDLSDSTHLSGVMESETYALMLDQVRQAFHAAVEPRGGTVNQYQGDGLQALFGHADPNEHDGRRAVDAALEVHEAVRALRARFQHDGAGNLNVHSGIHAGLALVRPGGNVAGRIELFGPAPGIAKHLSDVATADEILASDETLGPMGGLFEVGPPRRVLLKGRSEPLAVRRILARSGVLRTGTDPGAQRGRVPFIGRDEELARLDALLAGARAGHTRVGVLAGPAGLGKTRLAEEFIRRVSCGECTVLRGHCESDLSAEPLQPFLQMLRTVLQITPDAPTAAVVHAVETRLAGLTPALAAWQVDLLHALSLVPTADRTLARPAEQTVRTLHAVLTALARRGALVLFVDDWQWADDATRQLFHDLAASAGQGLLLLTAVRGAAWEEPAGASAEVLTLAPLAEHEAQLTVRELLPAVDPFVAGQIVLQGGGNPLFLEELCHFAASGSGAPLPAQSGPAWLEMLIAARVARLPAGPRRVVDAAAVIGTLVPAWLLERLAGCPADHPDVMALAAEDLLFPTADPGTLRFKHGITRDVVYSALGLHDRRAAHRRAAALLAAPGSAVAEAQACEALAHHYGGAGEHDKAAHYSAMAGDKAMLASSIDRAKAQYRAALERMDRLPPSAERYRVWRSVVRRLGLASVFDPVRADVPIFERAVALAELQNDAAGLAFASYWRAYIHYALGESHAAVRHSQAALLAAQRCGDDHLTLQVRALQGQALAAAGDSSAAETLLDAALSGMTPASASPARPMPGVAYTLACRASVSGDRGRLDLALATFERALAASPGPGHEVEGSVLCLRSNVHLWHGRWQDAAADAQAAHDVAERVRSLYLLAMSRSLSAWASWQCSGGERALRELQDATTWLIARDKGLFLSLNHGRLAEALAASGQPAEARAQAVLALQRWRRRDPFGAPMALRTLARLAAADGDRAGASRWLGRADRLAARRDAVHEQAANADCRSALALV